MTMNKFILSIFLTTTCGLIYAKCFSQADSENKCRFPSGDAWCFEHGNGNPYAYSDECLKGAGQVFKQQAEPVDNLEKLLINALKLNHVTLERFGDSRKSTRKSINAYAKKGYVNIKPDGGYDYKNYRIFKKPATFMGHKLIVIEEEYMDTWVGCCVSPGIGIIIKVVGKVNNLEIFASQNDCSFSDNININEEIVGFDKFPKGHYASLSCRERAW